MAAKKRILARETIVIGATTAPNGKCTSPGRQFNPGDEFVGVREQKIQELLKQGFAYEYEEPEPDLVAAPEAGK